MATGFPTKVNYATGDVLTAANMNDLAGTVNYLQYMPPRNPVLNSNFSIWQRGTSIAVTASTLPYTADRWQVIANANQALTISRQATNDSTNLPNIQYCMRFQRNNGQTGTGVLYLAQSFETINSITFAGKTVTLSFYARAGANYSATSNVLYTNLVTGTGTDQNLTGGYTGSATPINQSVTLTTTWQRFTITGTIAATATEIGVDFYYTPTGTAGAADYFEVTGVQLELGSVANAYMPNQPTYQSELAACQRYYWRQTGNAYSTYGWVKATSTTAGRGIINLPQQMRVAPTSIDYSTLTVSDWGIAGYAVTSLTLSSDEITPNAATVIFGVASGATAQRVYNLSNNNNTAGYLGFSAEL